MSKDQKVNVYEESMKNQKGPLGRSSPKNLMFEN